MDGVTRNSVLQAVSKTVTTNTTTTSETFVDATDMFLAITPTSATSKILVMFNVAAYTVRNATIARLGLNIQRNNANIADYAPYFDAGAGISSVSVSAAGTTQVVFFNYTPLQFLDSPATTNQITYKLQTAVYDNANTGSVQININNLPSTITLLEIAQ